MFITFEGGEGSGKSTQVKILAGHFKKQGREVIITREPGGTETAERIRGILLECSDLNATEQCFLNFAARMHHVENLIKPALKRGAVVICDRFFDSTYAYQGYAQGMHIKTIRNLHKAAIGTFKPDRTIILDIAPEEGKKRVQGRGATNHYDDAELEFHQKVRNGFLAIARKNCKRCALISASGQKEKVAAEILKNLLS